jgi:hypothetical protein
MKAPAKASGADEKGPLAEPPRSVSVLNWSTYWMTRTLYVLAAGVWEFCV